MNSNLLRAKIVEMGYNLKEFSELTGIKKTALYRKFSHKTEFSRSEIEKISDVLELSGDQIYDIFFKKEVS